jgi:membrane protein implicated in regulation of membrane protease activity
LRFNTVSVIGQALSAVVMLIFGIALIAGGSAMAWTLVGFALLSFFNLAISLRVRRRLQDQLSPRDAPGPDDTAPE